ncbi:MAG: cell division protein FtsZ [Oscillospiraceae bacterium]|nr:cell division protein FtsZ [Oscillospiraceae bacterium]
MAVSIESAPDNVVVIKVAGVGGAGNNVVNRMVSAGTQGVEFIAINTDKPALSASNAAAKVQIGEKLTMGQGAGSSPEIGKKAAEESRNSVAKALEDADMVFIAGGMGGGTGTGASPIVADIAREARALTVGVVTKPFSFEGKRRMEQAEDGIKNLLGKVDSLLVIPNDRLKSVSDQKLTFANAFEIADSVLHQAVVSISELIKKTGFINLDFADVTSIMKDAGFAHMGVGHAAGKGKAEEAARAAVTSPLMETSIDGARGVLVNITGSLDIDLDDVEIAASLVAEAAHPDANIIFGASFDENMEDEIRVVVIATRFDGQPKISDDISSIRAASVLSDSYVSKRVDDALKSEPVAAAPTAAVTAAPAQAQEPAAPPPPPPEPPAEEDPFDTIFKIFNSK